LHGGNYTRSSKALKGKPFVLKFSQAARLAASMRRPAEKSRFSALKSEKFNNFLKLSW
jgi:hypothetical protein